MPILNFTDVFFVQQSIAIVLTRNRGASCLQKSGTQSNTNENAERCGSIEPLDLPYPYYVRIYSGFRITVWEFCVQSTSTNYVTYRSGTVRSTPESRVVAKFLSNARLLVVV